MAPHYAAHMVLTIPPRPHVSLPRYIATPITTTHNTTSPYDGRGATDSQKPKRPLAVAASGGDAPAACRPTGLTTRIR